MTIIASRVRFTSLDVDGRPTGKCVDGLSAKVTLTTVEDESTPTSFVLEPVEFEVSATVDLFEDHRLRRLFGFRLTARGRRLRRYRRLLARQTSQTRRNKHGRQGVRR